MQSRLRAALVILLTVGLLAYFLRGVDLSAVWAETRHADGRLLVLGLAAVLVTDFPENEEGPNYWTASTDQVLVTTNRKLLEADPIRSVATEIPVPPGFRVWTDDFNNLLRVLK